MIFDSNVLSNILAPPFGVPQVVPFRTDIVILILDVENPMPMIMLCFLQYSIGSYHPIGNTTRHPQKTPSLKSLRGPACQMETSQADEFTDTSKAGFGFFRCVGW